MFVAQAHCVCFGGTQFKQTLSFFFFYIKLWLQWDSAVQGRMRKGWCWLYRRGGEGVEKINVWVPCELDSHGFLFALLTIPTIPISLHCCTVYHLVALIVFGFCGQKAVFLKSTCLLTVADVRSQKWCLCLLLAVNGQKQ